MLAFLLEAFERTHPEKHFLGVTWAFGALSGRKLAEKSPSTCRSIGLLLRNANPAWACHGGPRSAEGGRAVVIPPGILITIENLIGSKRDFTQRRNPKQLFFFSCGRHGK